MRLILLTDSFYSLHKNDKEILQKKERPYACLAVKINNAVFAIPFRHNINHTHAYFTCGKSGIDYSKAVVITDNTHIAKQTPQIAQAEYDALKGKDQIVYNGMVRYIKLYKKALAHSDNPYYQNILRFSALQYFHGYI